MALHRRQLLNYGLGLAGSVALGGPALAAAGGGRSIAFTNLHTGESLNATYWEAGAYVPDALAALNHLLRDHRTGAVHTIASKLNHAATNAAVTAERSLLATLEGGCQVPIGAYATLEGSTIRLRAIVASVDGSRIIRDEIFGRDELRGNDPLAVGRILGERLLMSGAREILKG